MIFVTTTPLNTGAAIYGDYKDFENLYEELHEVVGKEGEFADHHGAQIRVLGDDLRLVLDYPEEIEW